MHLLTTDDHRANASATVGSRSGPSVRPALTFANYGHSNGEVSADDVALTTSARVRGDLRAANDVLARQTSDIRARPADVSALDYRDTLPLRGKGPCSDSPSVPPPGITRSCSQGLLSCSGIIPFFEMSRSANS